MYGDEGGLCEGSDDGQRRWLGRGRHTLCLCNGNRDVGRMLVVLVAIDVIIRTSRRKTSHSSAGLKTSRDTLILILRDKGYLPSERTP